MTLPLPDLIAEVYGYYQILSIDDEDVEMGEITIEYFEDESDVELDEDGCGGSTDKTINIYELAFRIRDHFRKKDDIYLDMNFTVGGIFDNANGIFKKRNYFIQNRALS